VRLLKIRIWVFMLLIALVAVGLWFLGPRCSELAEYYKQRA
jgi:hypothetical protein